jgi:AAA15 family ATPase/GTPase
MSKRLLVSELKIESFRSFHDVVIPLGNKITVISGVNGVGKSNVLSLLASGSGINKKSQLGSNFQPEFTEFFNIDEDERYDNYRLYLKYVDKDNNYALARRLSFKNDRVTNRGIRIIPRATNEYEKETKLIDVEKRDKSLYDVGSSGRVKIPTIFMSLSRIYPLGEKKDSVKINKIKGKNVFTKNNIMEKYREWYNFIIPSSIKEDANLSKVEKQACSRASLHMDMYNIPTLSQSIGQDNVGNIVSVLSDIFILSLAADYAGAILCIDEIDVSLHPDTQIRIMELLDNLSETLKIQVFITTHSLTILKETLKKEKKNEKDYKVIYLKQPSAPLISKQKTYEALKADLFSSLILKDKIKVRMYFEDCIGQEIFHQLIDTYKCFLDKIERKDHSNIRNEDEASVHINEKITKYKDLINIKDKIYEIVTHLGCDSLIKIASADTYFKRVIIMLDGDARLEGTLKPKPKDYINKAFDAKGLSNRHLSPNFVFAPDYFAPETYLFRIIKKLYDDPLNHAEFWRSLDAKEETTLFSADKIKVLFQELPDEFSNDDLKKIFGDNLKTELWEFVKKSELLKYYYSDYKTVTELINFIDNLNSAYKMCLPLTLENKYL